MYCYRPLTLQQQTALDHVRGLERTGEYFGRNILDTATLNRLPVEAFHDIDPAILDKLPPDPNPFYTVWLDGTVYLFDELDPL